MHAAIGNAARTSASRRTRTGVTREACPARCPAFTRGLEHDHTTGLAWWREDRAVRDGALPVAVLASRRLRPLGVRRDAPYHRRTPRSGCRRVRRYTARLPALRGL